MRKNEIKSLEDPNFLKLGLLLILFAFFVLIASLIFDFKSIIAIRAGGGLGILIIFSHYVVKFVKTKK